MPTPIPQSTTHKRQSDLDVATASVWWTFALMCVLVFLIGCNERNEYSYASLADAKKAGEIDRGWMPDFLPASSREIHITYDPSSPRTWCAFEFSPQDSREWKLKSVSALPQQVTHVESPGEKWWPDFLKGDLDSSRIQKEDFVLYVFEEPDVPSGMRVGFFAMDWTKGRGFFYRS